MIVHLRGSEAVSHEPENVPGQTQRTPSRIDIRASTSGFPLCCDIRTRPSTTRLLLDIVVSVVTAHSSYAHTCRLHILQATRNRPISDSSSSCARPEDHFLLSLLPGLELGADERMKPARESGLAPPPLPPGMTPGHLFWISGIGFDGFISRVRFGNDGDDWDVEPRSRFPRCDAALPPLSATGSVLIIDLARHAISL